MSIEKVLTVAAGEVGYMETPANSNRTKYGAAYGLDGYAWCVMFLWWVLREANESGAFFGGARTASCGTLLRWYKEQGLTVPVSQVQPGDILILNFDGTGDTSHCGLVERVGGGVFYTIEGNTSSAGSQDNGGAVMRKTRYPAQVVGVCRPQYTPEPVVVSDYGGHWAAAAIEAVKAAGLMTGDPDGKFRPNDALTRAEAATIIKRLIERGDINA